MPLTASFQWQIQGVEQHRLHVVPYIENDSGSGGTTHTKYTSHDQPSVDQLCTPIRDTSGNVVKETSMYSTYCFSLNNTVVKNTSLFGRGNMPQEKNAFSNTYFCVIAWSTELSSCQT